MISWASCLPAPPTMDVPPPSCLLRPLQVAPKTLMGPGPSNPPTRVAQALSLPLLGHFHEATFKIMDEVKSGLQFLLQTRNALTLALSGSGHAGMEAALCNLLEPGDRVVALRSGLWGARAKDMAARYGGQVHTLESPLGRNLSEREIERTVQQVRPAVLFVTQGDSSTGVLQPVHSLSAICRRNDCLLVVDAVASMGGTTLLTDRWGVDCVYSGAQKVLGCPPGLTPITFSPRALEKIRNRRTPVAVYYFDMTLLGQYWGCFEGQPRIYHHTICTTLLYALREALAVVAEEGLEKCIKRHEEAALQLQRGLLRLGLQLFVEEPSARLPTVTTVTVPRGLDWAGLVKTMLHTYNMEIAGGLGPTAGTVLRIGVMGANANEASVRLCLDALQKALSQSRL